MAAEAPAAISYEDFEPLCKWKRDKGVDTLEVHLQGFKKNQLKIQLNHLGFLTITGERPLDDNKKSRFQKEIKLVKDHYKTNEIQARLSGGVLYIVMPKTPPPPSSPSEDQPTISSPPPQNQENKERGTKTGIDSITNKGSSTELEKDAFLPVKRSRIELRVRDLFSNMQNIIMRKKNIAAAVAVALVIVGAFIVYTKYDGQLFVVKK